MATCERCSSITLASLLSPEGHVHYESYASLQATAGKCEVCYVICLQLLPEIARAVVQDPTHRQIQQNSEEWVVLLEELATPITLRYTIGYDIGVANGEPRKVNRDPVIRTFLNVRCGRSKATATTKAALKQASESLASTQLKDIDITVSVPVFVYEGDPLAKSGVQVRQPLAPSSMDGSVVAKIKAWEAHCSETHAECRALSVQRIGYPTRLLDLHMAETEGISRVIDVTPDLDCEYVALSYCWGVGNHDSWISYVKTSQENAQQVIHIERMPQTLRDAVTCCLRLGYMYFWIDCLCIVQGHREDWLHESAKMSDIYANAALTISASDSKDCRDGFLAERSRVQRQGAVLNLTGDHTGDTSQLHLSPPHADFQKLVGDGPVAGRGWCLQERQLCSRLLHVCQSEVFFECMRCRRFESEAAPGDEFDLNDEFYAFHLPRDTHDTGRGKPSPDVSNIFSWYSIMQDYTRRGLTVPVDKLVAIAGLARRAHRTFGGEYLAGLWRKQIHVGLLWMIDDDASAFRAPTYRAPSWSWASMDGPVSWSLIDGFVQTDDGFIESAIEVVDSLVRLDGEDPFGLVQKVEIIVKGRLKSIPASELLANKVLTYPAWMSGSSPHIGCYLEDEKRVIEDEVILCLKIAMRPFGPGPSLPPTNEVILLQKVDESGSGGIETYRRLGFGQVLVTNYFDECHMRSIKLV